MPKIILSNDSDLRNIPTYDSKNKGGIMYNQKYVSKIYKGGTTPTLIYEDTSAPALESVEQSTTWADEVWEGVSENEKYKFSAKSTKTNPLPISGYTSHDIDMWYVRAKKGIYSNGTKIAFWDGNSTDNSDSNYGNLYVDGTLQDKWSELGGNVINLSKYVIPENTSACGKIYDVYKQTLENLEKDPKRHIYEYQTSDEYALFGLEEDNNVTGGFKLSSVRDAMSRTATHSYKCPTGTLTIIPSKTCMISISGSGYYFTKYAFEDSNQIASDLFGSYSITNLPSKEGDVLESPYKEAGFKELSTTLDLTKGQAVLLGFLEETTITFKSLFRVGLTTYSISSYGGNVIVGLTARSDLSWTATTTDSWISILTPSGTGTSGIVVSALKNTNNDRSGNVTLTSSDGTVLTVPITQKAYEEVLTFGLSPRYISVEQVAETSWDISETSASSKPINGLYEISFTPNISGDIELLDLELSENQGDCDANLYGATITLNNESFDSSEAMALLCGSGSNSYTVEEGQTYYLQIWKNPSSQEGVQLGVNLVFSK